MNNYHTIGELILNIVFRVFYIVILPFYGLYRLAKWFITAVFIETGNKLVKLTGGAIALSIFVYFTQHLLQ